MTFQLLIFFLALNDQIRERSTINWQNNHATSISGPKLCIKTTQIVMKTKPTKACNPLATCGASPYRIQPHSSLSQTQNPWPI